MKEERSILPCADVETVPAMAAGRPREMSSRHTTGEVQGWRDANSGFWRGAADAVMDHDSMARPVPRHRTEVRSRWTSEYLYFLFTCPYDELHLKPAPKLDVETNELWNWDVAEVFLGSDFENIRHYREFEISPQGEWVDLDVDLAKPRHEEGWVWNSGMTAAATIDFGRKVWFGAMRIPYKSVDSRPAAAGNALRINLYRSQGPSHQPIAWQPTGKETFHAPEAFGTLRLVD